MHEHGHLSRTGTRSPHPYQVWDAARGVVECSLLCASVASGLCRDDTPCVRVFICKYIYIFVCVCVCVCVCVHLSQPRQCQSQQTHLNTLPLC
jgi:hypothetical protein